MSAGVEAPLVRQFDLLATAPGGVARLRELILTLAVQGKLVPQDPTDEPASVLLQRIRAEKDRLIAAGKIKREKITAQLPSDQDLPIGWQITHAQELCVVITDGDHLPPPKSDDGIPFLVIGDVRSGTIGVNDATRFVPQSYFDALDWSKKPIAGDVLYTTVGSFGIPVPVVANQDFCFQRHIALFRPGLLELQGYLTLALRSKLAFDQAEAGATGIAQKTVPLSVLRKLQLPLPPLAEQSRIVTRVEELMRLCDALEQQRQLETAQHAQLLNTLLGTLTDCTSPDELAANWQRVSDHFDLLLDRPEAVDALEQTILQLAVRGLLVPQDPADEPASVLLQKIRAEKDRLISAGKIKQDKETSSVREEDTPFELRPGWTWVRFGAASINRDGERIPVSSSDRESRRKLYDYYGASGVIDKIDDYLFDKTLLLIGEDGANLINRSTPIAFLAHGKYWVNNHAHVIDTTHPDLMEYLALFINAISLEPYITGTAQPKMNQAKLNSIVVALPPLAEQTRIVARVTQLRDLCTTLRQRLAAAQTTQRHLAEALVEV
jgi:type I restriction enzyme S subunit